MAEFPALPIWTDAYLADTREFTAAQHGAYFLLMMTAWRTRENGLPDDDEKLSKWAAMDRRTWLKNKPIVMEKWCKIDGLFHQKRLDDERKRAEHVRESQVRAGLASALKRKQTESRHVATELPANHQPPSPSPSPSPSTSNEVLNPPTPKQPKDESFEKDFEDFWLAYPRKVAKGSALKAYKTARRKVDHATIMSGLRSYSESRRGQDPTYTAHPATWLNGGRWGDQQPSIGTNPLFGATGQSGASSNGREPRSVVECALRVAARFEEKDKANG